MKEKVSAFWFRLLRQQLRFRYPLAAAILIITAIFCWGIYSKLTVKTDFFALYPPSHPYIKLYKEFRTMFGSANVLSIIIERTDGKNIYNPVTLQKIHELTTGLMATKGCNPNQLSSIAHPKVKEIKVSQGIAIIPIMAPSVPKTQAEADIFKEKVYSNEGIRGIYISLDDTAAVVHAGFWEEGVDLKELYDEVQKISASVKDENHDIFISGYPMLYAWIANYENQILLILGATILAMFVLLIFYFRTIRGLLIPVASMVVSIIWGLGFAAYMGFGIDPLLLVIPLLLSARALSHSCQCLDRFHQEYLKTNNTHEAIVNAYAALYPPAILAIVTDGLGILAVAISTIPLMQRLAFFSSFWIISIFAAVVLLNPIILSFLAPPKVKRHTLIEVEGDDAMDMASQKGLYNWVVGCLYRWSNPGNRWVIVALILLIIFGGGYVTTTQLKVGDAAAGAAILYPDHPYNIAEKKMNTDFVGASRLIVIIKGKEKEAIKSKTSLDTMQKLAVFMQQNIEDVGGTLSLTDLVESIYRNYHEASPKWEMVPQNQQHLGQIYFMLSCNMAPGEMDQFVSLPDYTNSSVTAFMRDYNNESIKNAIAQVKDFAKDNEADPDSKIEIKLAGGLLGILAAVNEEVEWSYWAILIAIFSATFVLCLIAFRSPKVAVILLIPLAVSQVLCELIMIVLHIDLNIDSLPVAAVGVGVGIDYGIYLMSRLREEAFDYDFDQARLRALLTTGKVIMFTAATLFIGVVFWLFATMKFQAEMGMLIGLLMVFNMIGALVFIPALTGIMKPRFVLGRKGKEGIA